MTLTFWERHFGKDSWIVKYEKALTIFILIIGMIATIFAAYLGASIQAKYAYDQEQQQLKIHDENVAKLLYIDIQRQHFLLANTVEGFNNDNPAYAHPFIGKTYPDNGIYFAYQNEIASFDYPIAKNITQFYTDLLLVDVSNEAQKESLQNNRSDLALQAYNQTKMGYRDAYKLSSIIQNELEERYNISHDASMTIYQ